MMAAFRQEWGAYFKSSRSDQGGACVEVAYRFDHAVRVRDSKLGSASPVLEFAAHEWTAFLAGQPSPIEVTVKPTGAVEMRNSKLPASPVLCFTTAEWDAFEAGRAAGEFQPARPSPAAAT